MTQEIYSISRDRLLAAVAHVPVEKQGAFYAALFMGVDAAIASSEIPTARTAPRSFPLSLLQARELKERIDAGTWAILKEAVAAAVDGDFAEIDWMKIREITGVTTWSQFAQGRLGGLNRAFRAIEGVPSNAKLLWEADGWTKDGKGDYSSGSMSIDGPAVLTLRQAFGMHD